MKKKIILIIVSVVIIVVGYIAWEMFISDFIRNLQRDNNRINNCTTLSKYVEYHSMGYVENMNDEMSFYAENIKCDILNDKSIKHLYDDTWDNILLVLSDNTIYQTAFRSDKVFSNGQQYKQTGTDIQIKRVQKQDNAMILASEDNNYYKIEDGCEIKEIERIGIYNNNFIDNESIIKIQGYYKPTNDGNTKKVYLTLKTDGQIYEQEYETKYNSTTDKTDYILKNEKILFSNADYGHITDFKDGTLSHYNINGVTKIVSDKGLFYIKQTNDQQYIDTEPVYEMVASDIYNKYKADIKYIDTNYIFTTDNNIIATDMLCRDLDREVK